MSDISFGQWLSKQRRSLGLTQKQLAALVNCATITVRKIEAEQRRPSVQIAEQFAQVLNIPSKEHAGFLRFARGYGQPTPLTISGPYPWSLSTKGAPQPVPFAGSVEDHISSPQVSGFQRANTRWKNLTNYLDFSATGHNLETINAILEKIYSGGYIVLLVPIEVMSLMAESSLPMQIISWEQLNLLK